MQKVAIAINDDVSRNDKVRKVEDTAGKIYYYYDREPLVSVYGDSSIIKVKEAWSNESLTFFANGEMWPIAANYVILVVRLRTYYDRWLSSVIPATNDDKKMLDTKKHVYKFFPFIKFSYTVDSTNDTIYCKSGNVVIVYDEHDYSSNYGFIVGKDNKFEKVAMAVLPDKDRFEFEYR